MKNEVNHLYVFNLSTDSSNGLLAFTQDWVKAFSQTMEHVTVISTWVGKNELPNTISVTQVGGGDLIHRFKGIVILMIEAIKIVKNRKNAIVFHHMSPRTAVILGPIFRLFRIKQGLWYSHSNRTLELLIAEKFTNRIFSSTPEALPLKSNKARFTGHGILVEKFKFREGSDRKMAILSLGRIAPIKKNEYLIDAISKSKRDSKEVHLVGPVDGSNGYLEKIMKYGLERGVKVFHLGEVSHSGIQEILASYAICYTGNPNTVDKSVIEGALCGTFTLASQEFVLNQTGMTKILEIAGLPFTEDLTIQIENLDSIAGRKDLRAILGKYAAEQNSVLLTTQRIIEEIGKS